MTKVDLGMSRLYLKATSINNKQPSPAKLLLHDLVEDNLLKTVASVPSREEVTPRLTERQQVHKFMKDPQTNVQQHRKVTL